jgi:hypothetical protein
MREGLGPGLYTWPVRKPWWSPAASSASPSPTPQNPRHKQTDLREFWMNEKKRLHLGRNGVPSIQTDAQIDLPEHWPHQILKGGRRLLCANLADPAPAGAARGRGPVAAGAAGMSVGHGPPPAARGGGIAPVAAPGLSAGHGPRHAARGGRPATTATPSLSAGHGPMCAARSRGPATATTPSLSTGHGPLRAAHGRGPAAVVELRWTCGQR